MRIKGYDLENTSHHERLLNEINNDYGFNIRNKEVPNIFKSNIKAKASMNHKGLNPKKPLL